MPIAAGARRHAGVRMKVGLIGFGAMGLPMARHIVEAGHDVMVASRSRPPIDLAIGFGAKVIRALAAR